MPNIDELISKLDSFWRGKRKKGVNKLVEWGIRDPQIVIPALMKAMKSDKERVRKNVWKAYRRISKHVDVVPTLLSKINSSLHEMAVYLLEEKGIDASRYINLVSRVEKKKRDLASLGIDVDEFEERIDEAKGNFFSQKFEEGLFKLRSTNDDLYDTIKKGKKLNSKITELENKISYLKSSYDVDCGQFEDELNDIKKDFNDNELERCEGSIDDLKEEINEDRIEKLYGEIEDFEDQLSRLSSSYDIEVDHFEEELSDIKVQFRNINLERCEKSIRSLEEEIDEDKINELNEKLEKIEDKLSKLDSYNIETEQFRERLSDIKEKYRNNELDRCEELIKGLEEDIDISDVERINENIKRVEDEIDELSSYNIVLEEFEEELEGIIEEFKDYNLERCAEGIDELSQELQTRKEDTENYREAISILKDDLDEAEKLDMDVEEEKNKLSGFDESTSISEIKDVSQDLRPKIKKKSRRRKEEKFDKIDMNSLWNKEMSGRVINDVAVGKVKGKQILATSVKGEIDGGNLEAIIESVKEGEDKSEKKELISGNMLKREMIKLCEDYEVDIKKSWRKDEIAEKMLSVDKLGDVKSLYVWDEDGENLWSEDSSVDSLAISEGGIVGSKDKKLLMWDTEGNLKKKMNLNKSVNCVSFGKLKEKKLLFSGLKGDESDILEKRFLDALENSEDEEEKIENINDEMLKRELISLAKYLDLDVGKSWRKKKIAEHMVALELGEYYDLKERYINAVNSGINRGEKIENINDELLKREMISLSEYCELDIKKMWTKDEIAEKMLSKIECEIEGTVVGFNEGGEIIWKSSPSTDDILDISTGKLGDEDVVVTGSKDKDVHVIDQNEDKLMDLETNGYVRGVDIGEIDGSDFIVAGAGMNLYVWDSEGDLLWKGTKPKKTITSVNVGNIEGKEVILATSTDGCLYGWDKEGEILFTREIDETIKGLDFGENGGGNVLVLGGKDTFFAFTLYPNIKKLKMDIDKIENPVLSDELRKEYNEILDSIPLNNSNIEKSTIDEFNKLRNKLENKSEHFGELKEDVKEIKGELEEISKIGVNTDTLVDRLEDCKSLLKENELETCEKDLTDLKDSIQKKKSQAFELRDSIDSSKKDIENLSDAGASVDGLESKLNNCEEIFKKGNLDDCRDQYKKIEKKIKETRKNIRPKLDIDFVQSEGIEANIWTSIPLKVKNKGSLDAVDVEITVSGEIKVHGISSIDKIKSGTSKELEIRINASGKGNVPVEINTEYVGALSGETFEQTHHPDLFVGEGFSDLEDESVEKNYETRSEIKREMDSLKEEEENIDLRKVEKNLEKGEIEKAENLLIDVVNRFEEYKETLTELKNLDKRKSSLAEKLADGEITRDTFKDAMDGIKNKKYNLEERLEVLREEIIYEDYEKPF